MLQKQNGKWIKDKVMDDLSLVCDTDNGLVLICGCCHAGLLNTLNKIEKKWPDKKIDAVIGGTHMMICKKNNQTPSQAKDTIEFLLEIMKSTLASREDIMISGFGKFQVNEKAPRKGRNPATGKSMMLKKRRVVVERIKRNPY